MTRLPFILLASALALAGCLTPDAAPSDANNSTSPTTPMPFALPPPIEDSKEVTGGADPFNFVTGAPCDTPSAQCFPYPFTLNGTATIDAALIWGVPANDFDMYVFQDGAAITSGEGASPPGAPAAAEGFTLELEAGSYELVVVAWSVARDTYTVSATFS